VAGAFYRIHHHDAALSETGYLVEINSIDFLNDQIAMGGTKVDSSLTTYTPLVIRRTNDYPLPNCIWVKEITNSAGQNIKGISAVTFVELGG